MPASTRNYAQAKAALESNPQPYAQTIDGEIERIEDSKTVIVNKLNSMYTDKDKTIYNENSPLIYTLTNNINYYASRWCELYSITKKVI